MYIYINLFITTPIYMVHAKMTALIYWFMTVASKYREPIYRSAGIKRVKYIIY